MNIADLDFLTPGSVFTREDGRESRFLFLTNTALPKKVQSQYPPQVVYADENNNILSCDIDRFLNKRKFHLVDPELEARLENLLALSNSDGEDALDLDGDAEDGLIIEDDGEEGDGTFAFDGEVGAAEGEVESDSPDAGQAMSISLIPSGEGRAVLDAEFLSQAVSSYQQAPGTAPGSVQHSLFIRADRGINRASLLASFSPSAEQTGNSIYTFEVELEGIKVHVDWDEFLGVYPCVFYGSMMYQVIFNTFARPVESSQAPVAVEPSTVELAENEAVAEVPVIEVDANEAAAEAELAEIERQPEPVAVQPVTVSVQ